MKKYLPILFIFLGGITNFLVLTPIYIHSLQTIIGLLLGIIITILAFFNYKKAQIHWQKVCLILGGIINIYPVLYFTLLFFALG